MSHPLLRVRIDRIRENARAVVDRCAASGIRVVGVAKGICGEPRVARAMAEGGCVALGDSRLDNLERLREARIGVPLHLIRIPMEEEISRAARIADLVLISDVRALRALDEAADREGRRIGVTLMMDMGDLREGFWPDEENLRGLAELLPRLKSVEPVGVGVNLGCFGGVLASPENLGRLVAIRDELASRTGLSLPVVSGGATLSLVLLERGEMPPGVNELRVGEAILLGTDVTGTRDIPWLRQDTMLFEAQVVEERRKPSVPVGRVGADAFGNVPVFEDRGIRRRAIVAAGRQDVRPEGLTPLDPGVRVLGASSDHLILDVEEAPRVRWGSLVTFQPSYGAMLAAATSSYVLKEYRDGAEDPVGA
jgi:predicted amino acid racemase